MIKPEMFQRGKGDREWADANNKGVVIMAQSEKIAVGKFYPNEVEPVSSTYAFSYDNLLKGWCIHAILDFDFDADGWFHFSDILNKSTFFNTHDEIMEYFAKEIE